MYPAYPSGTQMPEAQRPPAVIFLWQRASTAFFKGIRPQ